MYLKWQFLFGFSLRRLKFPMESLFCFYRVWLSVVSIRPKSIRIRIRICNFIIHVSRSYTYIRRQILFHLCQNVYSCGILTARNVKTIFVNALVWMNLIFTALMAKIFNIHDLTIVAKTKVIILTLCHGNLPQIIRQI